MNNIIVSSNDRIENSIYEIRGKQVMLVFEASTIIYHEKNMTCW